MKIRFNGRVTADETQSHIGEISDRLNELEPGFVILADLTRLESMDPKCAADLGRVMELCDQHGVSKVVRVIPDPRKDIGFNILSVFHYRRHVPIITCKTLEEAAEVLAR